MNTSRLLFSQYLLKDPPSHPPPPTPKLEFWALQYNFQISKIYHHLLYLLYSAPEGAPINVVSSDVMSTSLTLTWGPPQNTLQNGVIRHYIITALEINTGTNFTYQAQSRTTFSIGDLHPYYTYQFNVFAVTVEVGPSSMDHRVTTPQDGMNHTSDS